MGLTLPRSDSAARRTAGLIKRWLRALPGNLWFGVIFVVFTALRPIIRLRIATFDPYRIGEFICRIDMAIALVNLAEPDVRTRSRNYFILPPQIANEQLRVMYARALSHQESITLLDCRTSWLGRRLIAPARRIASKSTQHGRYSSLYCGEGQATMETCGLRPSGRPVISFTPDELEHGWGLLRPLGIGPTTRYVCLHVRDSAYLRTTIPERDWSYHDYRNPPIESYMPMVEEVLARGYTIVRMGKVVECAFPLRHERLLDYAVSGAQNDFLDVFLYANATLAIAGSVSGIDQLGHAFNVPIVASDYVPFDDPRWATDSALVIPALVRDSRTGELLPLSRLMASRYGSVRHYQDAGLHVVPNSPVEISEVVLEAILRVEGTWTDTTDGDERQTAFWAWAEDCGIAGLLPPGPWDDDHYRARIGSVFLQTYAQQLLT